MTVLPEAEALALETSDGELLDAGHAPRADRDLAVVLAHGFTGSWRKSENQAVMRGLGSYAGVVAFDFRGHGRSSGVSTVGDREVLDVAAAVAAARASGYRKVATCGWSMGGATVLRHAALRRGVNAVVSVSAPARWYYRGTKPMRRVHFTIEHPVGRELARRLLHTRIADRGWDPVPESPEQVVGMISVPLLLVHGDRDAFFPVEHVDALSAAAGATAETWVVPGFAHAESGATPELIDRLGLWLAAHT